MSLFNDLVDAAGVTLEVRTRFGGFTVNPQTGENTPGDTSGGSPIGAVGQAIWNWLRVSFVVHTSAGSVGPFDAY